MPVLARKADKGQLWTHAANRSRWEQSNFPYQLLPELSDQFDGKGLSFWQFKTIRDSRLKRLVAALEAEANDLRSVDFRFLDMDVLERLDLQIKEEPGATHDEEVNQLHVNIYGITGPQAVEIARAMAFRKNRAFAAVEVGRLIAISYRSGYFDKDTKFHRDMLQKLWRENLLRF